MGELRNSYQIHDITSQVLAEGAFQESNERLADIARHLPDAMFAVDRKGVVAAWNLAIEKLTGIPAKETMSTPSRSMERGPPCSLIRC